MSIEIITTIIASVLGIIGLVINSLININNKRAKAELKKLEAETNKTNIETANLVAELNKSSQLDYVRGTGVDNIENQTTNNNSFSQGGLKEINAQDLILHRQLKEWKELHNKLHDLQMSFALCRDHAPIQGDKNSNRRARNKVLRQNETERFSMNWKHCKLFLNLLREVAQDLRYISPVKNRDKEIDPEEEMKKLDHFERLLDDSLRDSDKNLVDIAGDFSLAVELFMFGVDKSLKKVADQINELQ
jgi:hypothetical protein